MSSIEDKYIKDSNCKLEYKKILADRFVSTLKNNTNNTFNDYEKFKVSKSKEPSTNLLTSKINKLKEDLRCETKAKIKYKSKLLKVSNELCAAKDSIGLLEDNIYKKDKSIDLLVEELSDAKLEIENLKKSCSKLNIAKSKLDNLANGRLNTITSLNSRLKLLKDKSDVIARSISYTAEVNAEFSRLNNKIDFLQRDRSKLLTQIDKLKSNKISNSSTVNICRFNNNDSKITSIIGRFKYRRGLYYFESLNGDIYYYQNILPLNFNKHGFYCSVIISSVYGIKHISYLSLTAKSLDDYLVELTGFSKPSKVFNRDVKVQRVSIRKIFNNEKVLICSSYKTTYLINYMIRLGLDVKLFDSYNQSPNILKRDIRWAEYIVNVTGSSKHFVDTIVASNLTAHNKSYTKVYKLTQSNFIEIFNGIVDR